MINKILGLLIICIWVVEERIRKKLSMGSTKSGKRRTKRESERDFSVYLFIFLFLLGFFVSILKQNKSENQ